MFFFCVNSEEITGVKKASGQETRMRSSDSAVACVLCVDFEKKTRRMEAQANRRARCDSVTEPCHKGNQMGDGENEAEDVGVTRLVFSASTPRERRA